MHVSLKSGCLGEVIDAALYRCRTSDSVPRTSSLRLSLQTPVRLRPFPIISPLNGRSLASVPSPFLQRHFPFQHNV